MKQIIFFLSAIILLGCNQKHKKDDLVGIWDVVSLTDIETGEELSEGDNEFVDVRLDSLYLNGNNAFAWQIKGDSILLDGFVSVYIKEMTTGILTVEYDFYGETRLRLIKRK